VGKPLLKRLQFSKQTALIHWWEKYLKTFCLKLLFCNWQNIKTQFTRLYIHFVKKRQKWLKIYSFILEKCFYKDIIIYAWYHMKSLFITIPISYIVANKYLHPLYYTLILYMYIFILYYYSLIIIHISLISTYIILYINLYSLNKHLSVEFVQERSIITNDW